MAQVILLTESVELIRQAKPLLAVLQAARNSMVHRLERTGSEIQDLYDSAYSTLVEIQNSFHDNRDTDLLEGQVEDLKNAAGNCLLKGEGFGELDMAIEAIENISNYPLPLMDRFWCGTIDEKNGEQEYQHVIFYRDQTEAGAQEQHRHMTATFYPHILKEEEEVKPDEFGVYEFGDISCTMEEIWEISKRTYDDMKKGGLC